MTAKNRQQHSATGNDYWWFAYDVIKKHVYANYDRFVPNFDMAYKTIKRISVPNLKSFRPTKTELRAKEDGECSIMLYGKMGWGRSLAYQHSCRNINVWRSSKF